MHATTGAPSACPHALTRSPGCRRPARFRLKLGRPATSRLSAEVECPRTRSPRRCASPPSAVAVGAVARGRRRRFGASSRTDRPSRRSRWPRPHCARRDQLLAPLDGEAPDPALRFGSTGEPRTLEEVGEHFNLTRERIRQIEARAMSKLRHQRRHRRPRPPGRLTARAGRRRGHSRALPASPHRCARSDAGFVGRPGTASLRSSAAVSGQGVLQGACFRYEVVVRGPTKPLPVARRGGGGAGRSCMGDRVQRFGRRCGTRMPTGSRSRRRSGSGARCTATTAASPTPVRVPGTSSACRPTAATRTTCSTSTVWCRGRRRRRRHHARAAPGRTWSSRHRPGLRVADYAVATPRASSGLRHLPPGSSPPDPRGAGVRRDHRRRRPGGAYVWCRRRSSTSWAAGSELGAPVRRRRYAGSIAPMGAAGAGVEAHPGRQGRGCRAARHRRA